LLYKNVKTTLQEDSEGIICLEAGIYGCPMEEIYSPEPDKERKGGEYKRGVEKEGG